MGSKYFKILLFSFICSLLIGNCHLGFAQKSTIDSLKTAYQNATHDTTKAKLLVELSEHIYLLNPDSVIPFCQRAIEIIEINLPNEQVDISHVSPEEESSFLLAKARALNNIGFIHQQQGDIKKGLEYYFESVKIYKKYLAENLDEETFLKKEKIFKKCLTDAYINIGFIYNNQGEIEKGLEYYYLSLKIKEEIKDKKGLAGSYNNIGTVYHNQGEIEMALEYYFMSLKIKEEIKDKKGIANSYHNIGGVLGKLDSLDEGMKYLELGLKLNKELGLKAGVASSYSTIGDLKLKLGHVEVALKSGLESIAVAKEIGHVEYMGRAAELLSDVYKKQGKFKDALVMYELEIQMRDSIVNDENTKSTIRQQMKYEYEKEQLIKEQEEKERSRQLQLAESRRNRLHYSAIFIGILVLFGGIMALGVVKIPAKGAEAIIFISFLILFEFLLILLDPYIEKWTGGAPVFQLMFNALIAGCIFPLHSFFETKLKGRLIKTGGTKLTGGIMKLMIIGIVLSHTTINAQTSKNSDEQSRTIDSLKSAYEIANHDTTKVKLLVELTVHLYLQYPDTMIPLCQQAIQIIDENLSADKVGLSQASPEEECSFLHTKANALNNIGFIYDYYGEIDKALEYYFECIKIYEKFLLPENVKKWSKNLGIPRFLNIEKLFKRSLATAYNNVGVIYMDQGGIEKALEYYFLSLKIKDEINDKKGMAVSYNNIGGIYDDQGEIEKALEYYFLSLKIKEEIKDKKGMAYSYNNIGFIHDKQGEIEKALEYFFLSLKIREEINDKKGMATSYHNIGNMLCNLDSLPDRQAGLEEGMKYLQLGLGLYEELGNKTGVSASNSTIGGWQLKLGQVETALKSGLEALIVAKEVGHVEYMERAAMLLSEVYIKQGEFEDALTMFELEIVMRDSIVNEENQRTTIRQQMKYEHEKEQIILEQKEIEQARIQTEVTARRDNLQHSAIFIGILILFGSVLMLGFVKVRPKNVAGIIFIAFLILFEFILVLADPQIEQYSGGAPGYKLLFNAGIAGLMFPLHQFFERKLKRRIIRVQRKRIRQTKEQFKKDVEEL